MKKIKEEKNIIKRPFLVGFWFSLLLIVTLASFFISFPYILKNLFFSFFILSSYFYIFSFIFYLVVLSSFYYLGKKYKNNLLKKSTIILGVFSIIAFFLSLIFLFNIYLKLEANHEVFSKGMSYLINKTKEFDSKNPSFLKETFIPFLDETLTPFFIFIIVSYLIYAVIYTFFSVGLIKIKDSSYSKILGILNIITVWIPIITPIIIAPIISIFLVPILIIICLVFQCLLFYEQAKKADGKS